MNATNMIVKAWLDIAPMGKARPRVTANGTFMPEKYTEWKEELRRQFGLVWIPDDWVIYLDVVAFVAMPKSWSKKKREAQFGLLARTRPDVDNLAGSILDAVFLEDRAIASLSVSRRWGYNPAVSIEIDMGLGDRADYALYPVLVERPGHERLMVHVPAASELDARVIGIYAALKLDKQQVTKDIYYTVEQYPLYGSAVITEEGCDCDQTVIG